MFTLKIKKSSIIAGAIASTITLSTFSSFAIGPTTEPLVEQSIGLSNELSSLREQKVDGPINASENSVNEKTIEAPKPKKISLSKPGDYRLVGAGVSNISENQNPNEIVVNTNDIIIINGDGRYNVILDNVNIDLDHKTAFVIRGNSDVNLILAGKNCLKSCAFLGALHSLKGSAKLTITESSEGASLDASSGISADNVTINSGTVTTERISADNITINSGMITTESIGHNSNLNTTINGGIITTKEILTGNLIINGGTITTTKISTDNIIKVNGGALSVEGINKRTYEEWCNTKDGHITIDGGTVIMAAETPECKACLNVQNIIINRDVNNEISYIDRIDRSVMRDKNITISIAKCGGCIDIEIC